jgi:hypothetical protein
VKTAVNGGSELVIFGPLRARDRGYRDSASSRLPTLSLLAVTVAIWRVEDCPGEHLATLVDGLVQTPWWGCGRWCGVPKVPWPSSVGLP